MNKQDELSIPTSCFNKAAVDEPIFVLRAKDPQAAKTVRLWAVLATGKHEDHKVQEAFRLAEAMDKWREKHVAPVPTLDRHGVPIYLDPPGGIFNVR